MSAATLASNFWVLPSETKLTLSAFLDTNELKANVSQEARDWAELGWSLFNLGRSAEALVAYKTALELEARGLGVIWPPERFYVRMGDALLHAGDIPGARASYEVASEEEDDDIEAAPSAAWPRLQLLSSEEDVQKALSLFGPNAREYDFQLLGFNFASAYWEDDAIEVFTSFLPSQNREHAHAWWGVGIFYVDAKRPHILGAQAMRLCTELDPTFDLAFDELGWLYVQMHKPEEAVVAFEKAMALRDQPRKDYQRFEAYAMATYLAKDSARLAEAVQVMRSRDAPNEGLLQLLEQPFAPE